MTKRLRAYVLLAATIACASDASQVVDPPLVIVDTFGGPLGYLVIHGTVRSLSGSLPVNSLVDIGGCRPAVWGATTTTNAQGAFSITSSGPLVDLMPSEWQMSARRDTLHADGCRVIVNRNGIARDSIDVRFGPTAASPAQYTLDVTVP